jgi:hypothetical protein
VGFKKLCGPVDLTQACLDSGFTHCPPFGRSALASLEAAEFVPIRTIRFRFSLVTFGHVSLRSTRLCWMKFGQLGSEEFWTHFGSPKLNTPLLETTHPYEGATGGHAVSVFPFQFIDARRGPSKASGPRLRGRKCQRCPIVLRAWNKLSACIPHGQSSRSHSSLAGLVHLSRFRPGWAVFVRATTR